MSLVTGSNSIDFGLLYEGDANHDNLISILDFSILSATFGKSQGGYDEGADLNGDGCITPLDFSQLASNFGQSGEKTKGKNAVARN